jgi:myosin heavy subunit
MDDAAPDPEEALKADRKALVQSLEGKLAKVRRAKKSLEEEEDLDSVQVLIRSHAEVEQDLESKLRQARAQYQELRPAEVKLHQAQRDLEATKHKLDNTKDEIQQVEELIAKQQARLHRLQEQQELQVAKLRRLEAAIKEHHASIGGGKSGGASGDSPPPSLTTLSPQDLTQCPAFVQLQQAYERMQGELKEAMAALAATQPPATKREREEPQVTDDESPALKK